eukprot:6175748-Pleurochrysis_carterae.AAC.3
MAISKRSTRTLTISTHVSLDLSVCLTKCAHGNQRTLGPISQSSREHVDTRSHRNALACASGKAAGTAHAPRMGDSWELVSRI